MCCMKPRPMSHALSACVLIALAPASSSCARQGEASAPAIPTVVSIPVAPLRSAAPPTTTSGPAAALSVATGQSVDATSLPLDHAAAREPIPAASAVAEPVPAAPLTPHVVLVDELPYRWSPGHGEGTSLHSDAAEHPHAQSRRHGHGARPYHPAPGVVVDVTEGQGGAVAADLQRAARSAGYWPFRRCYEDGLRRDPVLSGRVSLDVLVSAGGTVDHASVASATLRDESVALCLTREASHLTLSSPRESPTKVEVAVTLSSGDEPVVAPRPVPHADELREALRAAWPAVEQCYVAELAKHPDIGGRLELRFHARPSGQIVEVAEEGENRFADVDVTRCVLGVYRTTKLARIHSARDPRFGYAIHLEAR
jgi:hypothetical protein